MSNQDILSALSTSRDMDYDTAWSMPAQYYCSEEFLKLETERLFYRQWVCVGRQEQIADPGDYFVTDVIDESVLVVRDPDTVIRAFSNVCRHRGTQVVDGCGNARQFVCPYHAWTYDTAGKLINTPHVQREACNDISLVEFRCEVWSGFIYVNLDADAQALAPQLAGLQEMAKNYHMESMQLRYSSTNVWRTNWKCLAENFMEGYHLSHVHRTTLHPITPTNLCEHFEPGPAYLGYFSNYPPDLPSRGEGHEDVTAQQRQQSLMFSVLPAHVAGVGAHAMFYLQLQPRGVDHVQAQLGIAVFDEQMPQAEVDRLSEFFEQVMAEDEGQLERLNRGLRSRFHQPGVLGSQHHEGTVLDYYRYMDRMLSQ